MAGDIVQTAADVSGGNYSADEVLKWLANIVRALRDQDSVSCGKAGHFSTTEEQGTVEINPATKNPIRAYARKTLNFSPSDELRLAVSHDVVSDEMLRPFDCDDGIGTCFGRALATILIMEKRASIGNFGTWSIGQKPNMDRFIKFRPKSAINRML